MAEHKITKGEYAYHCTECGTASGDGSGITGECPGVHEAQIAPFSLIFTAKQGHDFTPEDIAENAEFAKGFYAQGFTESDIPSGVESVTIKRT